MDLDQIVDLVDELAHMSLLADPYGMDIMVPVHAALFNSFIFQARDLMEVNICEPDCVSTRHIGGC